MHFAARTDVGLTRANNQDSGYAGPHLLLVADGMGGAAGGDIASSIAVGRLAALDERGAGSRTRRSTNSRTRSPRRTRSSWAARATIRN